MNNNIKRMAEMSVKRLLIVMALPAIVSMFVQALYNVVDSIYIARIGEDALAAISLAFPVQMVMISISVGLSIGVSSYVSRKLGEGRKDQAAAAAEHGMVLAVVVWAILCICNYFFIESFYRLFTDDPVTFEYSLQYTNVVVYGSLGMILSIILISIKQATGDMVSPMKVQLIGAVSNIILDPIMIFGLLSFPALGVFGAGLATVCGQVISALYALWKLKNNPLELKISKLHVNFKLDMAIVQEVLKVGVPSMFIQGLGAIMVCCINYILAGYSQLAVAAFGAFFKVNAIFFMPLVGLTQGMMPVVGYNFGAKSSERVRSAIKYSMMYSVIFMIFATVALQIFAEPIMYIFSDMPELVAIGVSCMRIISMGFVLFGITVVLVAAYQAFGIAKLSLYSSILRQLGLLIPLAFILSWMFGLNGVWAAFPVTEGLSLIFTGLYALKLFRSRVEPAMNASNAEEDTE